MAIKTLDEQIKPEYEKLRKAYVKQKYHFIGKYAVVKPCHWLKKSLLTRGKEYCYKQKFYGIPSHRCLQMSPTIFCNERCIFCWRAHPEDVGARINELGPFKYDDPEDIVKNSLVEWRRVLIGYKGNPSVDRAMLEEALRPIHVAISLVGEPTMYPHIGQLIDAYFKHGFKTAFLVTNGTRPDVLEKLEREPSQLYVSVVAPDLETFKVVTKPIIPVKVAWNSLMKTLELLQSFKVPTVMRITLVKGYNMKDVEKYAKLVELAQPTYVEPKAAMSVGYFKHRLSVSNMPRFSEVKEFGMKLAELTGYKMVDEAFSSRIVLLSQLDKPIKLI